MFLCNLHPLTTAARPCLLFCPKRTSWDRHRGVWVAEAALLISTSPLSSPVPDHSECPVTSKSRVNWANRVGKLLQTLGPCLGFFGGRVFSVLIIDAPGFLMTELLCMSPGSWVAKLLCSFFLKVQHLRREPYRAQNRDRRDSEGNEVQKDTQASKELKVIFVYLGFFVPQTPWRRPPGKEPTNSLGNPNRSNLGSWCDYKIVESAMFGARRLRLAIEVAQDKVAPRPFFLPLHL